MEVRKCHVLAKSLLFEKRLRADMRDGVKCVRRPRAETGNSERHCRKDKNIKIKIKNRKRLIKGKMKSTHGLVQSLIIVKN